MKDLAVFFDIGDTLVSQLDWQDGAQVCLNQLRAEGARLGTISNTDGLSRQDLAAHLPVDFDFSRFDDHLVLLSSELGIEKPDPAIFRKAINLAGLDARNCIFVGEDLSEILAAQAVGMRTCRVTQFPRDFEILCEFLKGD